MRYFLLINLFWILFFDLVGQTYYCNYVNLKNCQSTCSPEVFIGERSARNDIYDCENPIDRFLARTLKATAILDSIGTPYYCSILDLAAKNNATLLKDFATKWGNGNHEYYLSIPQMICDIREAYAKYNHPMPLVDFNFYEYQQEGVLYHAICSEVLEVFKDELEENNLWPYPYTHFDIQRIIYDAPMPKLWPKNPKMEDDVRLEGTPDITKIEARMFMLYQAKIFIDAGFSVMGFGDLQKMVIKDDQGFFTNDIIQKIKKYAEIKNQPIYLFGSTNTKQIKYEGKFLFDFINAPQRPEECIDCLKGTPCENDLQAEIILAKGSDIPLKKIAGLTTNNCKTDYLPVLFDWDNHSGLCEKATPGIKENFFWCTYGLDEGAWLNTLSEDCLIHWLEKYVGETIERPRTYFSIPIRVPMGYDLKSNSKFYGNFWDILQHPKAVNSIPKLFYISESNKISYSEECKGFYGFCKFGFKEIHRKKRKNYQFSMLDNDRTSVLVWEIKNEKNKTIFTSISKKINFRPKKKGKYTILVQKQNAAAKNNSIPQKLELDLTKSCCNN
jgi:hypothetical protein